MYIKINNIHKIKNFYDFIYIGLPWIPHIIKEQPAAIKRAVVSRTTQVFSKYYHLIFV